MTVLRLTAVRHEGDRDFYSYASDDGAIVREFERPAAKPALPASVNEFEDAHGTVWQFHA